MSRNGKLFVVSFLVLFLEVLLIRWVSTEIRIFAYMTNLVLLACFLGVGSGCYLARRQGHPLITAAMLLLIALSVKAEPFRSITGLLSGFSDSVIWYQSLRPSNLVPALQGLALTLFLFLLILAAFIPLGQIMGRLLNEHPRTIEGYSVNVGASLIGIWVFNIIAMYYLSPWIWFLIALILLFCFIPPTPRDWIWGGLTALSILLIVGFNPSRLLTIWSPYQKLDVQPNIYQGIQNGVVVNVNNVGYMSLMNLSEDFIKRYPDRYDPSARAFNQYELPYAFKTKVDSVLIVGSGGGNDAAGALRAGVRTIDAVEIDPGIYRLGLALHPERPYENPRVRISIDDARAFFKKTARQYDLIAFGLLDSHTLSSGYNNTRLDHYVYTEESFREARSRLKPDGVISVSFATQTQWIRERLYGLLEKVFGGVPYVMAIRSPGNAYGWGGIMFITGNDIAAIRQIVASKPELLAFVQKTQVSVSAHTRLTTDDWPYIYLEKPAIPRMFLLMLGALLILLVAAQRFVRSEEKEHGSINWHFFFLGAAFLLLEFQNVSKSSLLFGSTWMVNAHIISAILVLILLANLFVSVVRPVKRLPYYLLLLGAVMSLYLVPLEIFNAYGGWTKTIGALFFLNLPIFFAGIIFIQSFAGHPDKDTALGSNLLGAALGGLLETLSFVVGIKALILAVALLYLLSAFFLLQQKKPLRNKAAA